MARVPFLAPVSITERRHVADHTDLATYAPWTTIVARDEPSGRSTLSLMAESAVLHSGKAAGALPLAEIGPGDFFGEMAPLKDAPRSAEVIAVTPTACALLTWEVIERNLLGNQGVATALLIMLSRRLRALSELHDHPQVATQVPPKERERRILRGKEMAVVVAIRGTLLAKEHNHFTLCDRGGHCPVRNRAGIGLHIGALATWQTTS